MQCSSESIGAIAAALAKAQAELANPEKSMVATIRASHPRENDQTFRYAALSSGLDIVRKALGGHDIATVQTTAIDKEAGLIRLTTTLAHSPGEWLSSEWPVCTITETAAPRRMGAALTYARRYALFTLVGIAGEDDLDAPDLGADGYSDPQPDVDVQTWTTPATDAPSFARSGGSRKGRVIRPPRIVLAPDQSKALGDRLVAELSDLKSADEAADWAHKNLPAKNTLTAADAEIIEASFRERLATIESGQENATAVKAVAIPGDESDPNEVNPSTPSRQPPLNRPFSRVVAPQRKPFAYVTRSTANSSPRSLASSAAAHRPKRITFALLNRVRSTAKSATSTRSQSAASIIASCTDMAMKLHGGSG
jgi:hypothetical protein